MSAVLHPATEDRAAFLERRRSGIGGSDAAAIAGIHPYKTALDVYLDKLGINPVAVDSEAAEWGVILEPVVLEQYAQRSGLRVLGRDKRGRATLFYPDGKRGEGLFAETHHARPLLDTLQHADHPWMLANIDGVALDENDRVVRGIEAKTSSAYRSAEWGREVDETPEEYIVQVHHYAEVLRSLGHEVPFDVPVLIGGQSWRVYTIEPNRELIGRLVEMEADFWRRVQEEHPPEPGPGEAGKLSLARMYPNDAGEDMDATDPDSLLHELSRHLHAARTLVSEAEAGKTGAENAIKSIMADASRVNLGGKSYLSWANNKPSERTDWEAAARELADLLAWSPAETRDFLSRHTTTKPGPRVFRAQGLDKLFGEG